MFTLPESALVKPSTGAWWKTCAGCGALFAAAPGQTYCRGCEPGDPQPSQTARCGAAHPEDRSGCDGPVDAVRVVDQVDDEVSGCVRHAAVVLASVEDARVYPGSVAGAAIAAYRRAQLLDPFAFDPVDPRPARTPAGGVR